MDAFCPAMSDICHLKQLPKYITNSVTWKSDIIQYQQWYSHSHSHVVVFLAEKTS